MINVSDPHKPFYAQGRKGETIPDPHVPSRVFTPEEVPVPGFLFDDPVVRKELSHYYSSVRRAASVRRADDCVREILAALKASGQENRTLVLFLSDHGMPLPFAKTQVYHHSTRTPLIVRWPGRTPVGAVDNRHMVSGVDFLPTLLDVTGIAHPPGLEGRSFASLLNGEPQDRREMIIKEYNENAGGSRDPMRAVQTKKFLYIFNPWSNGQRIMATATTGTQTYRRLAELAKTNPALAARHELYQHRVVEELYDVAHDPDCLKNLIADPAQAQELQSLRRVLESWMVQTRDPLLDVFRRRDDTMFRERRMLQLEEESNARRQKNRKQRNRKQTRPDSV
jgi:N-sulfoglucosamine sulfohydrolase